jgi:hypothetical protein
MKTAGGQLIIFLFIGITLLMTARKGATQMIDVRKLKHSKEVTVVAGEGYFPVITRLTSGELAVIMRAGASHMGIGGRLDIVWSADSGESWSKPRTVVDSERDDRNPAVGLAPDGALVLGYHWQGGYDADGTWNPGPYKQDTKITRSADGGKTWDEPVLLNLEIQRGNSPYGHIFTDPKGALYIPIYGAKNPEPGQRIKAEVCHTFLIKSNDAGKTWYEAIDVAPGFNEAAYLILPNGDWLCAARSQKHEEQAIYCLRSTDSGQTWSTPVQVTNSKEHPADLTLLSDGSILLVFGVRNQPCGVQGMLSRDNGRTWLKTRMQLADHLPRPDIGYPSTVRLPNGRMVTVYYRADAVGKVGDPTWVSCIAVCYDEAVLLAAFEDRE